jgi:hypothetical protein
METHMHAHDDHHARHEMPTSGRALNIVAVSATLHCLTGCAIGEVLGMVIGTALGFSAWGTSALAVGLAFLFGYGLTSLPLLRAGLALSAVIPVALASDTLSPSTAGGFARGKGPRRRARDRDPRRPLAAAGRRQCRRRLRVRRKRPRRRAVRLGRGDRALRRRGARR